MLDELILQVEQLRAEGAVVILKWDGERSHAGCTVVLEAIDRTSDAKRKPKGFLVHECTSDLRDILRNMKASKLTRAAHAASDA